MGLSVSIPLRIFDRNQGEKLRTQHDIRRNERLRDATEALIYSDVDSAYATLQSTVILLQPYKAKYLEQATTVRETVTFSYERGAASLLDFLGAQNDYRTVQRSYLSLVGAYLSAAAQLNRAVGREVIP
jgi:cobalt-zinc-cadmium efflux system outer membrane protein